MKAQNGGGSREPGVRIQRTGARLGTWFGLVAVLWSVGFASAQQFAYQTNVVTMIPAVTWRGTNALVVANQLLGLTNAGGGRVIPPAMFTNHSSTLLIRVECGTNGILKFIRARIAP